MRDQAPPKQSLQTRWSIRKLVDYTECATARAARGSVVWWRFPRMRQLRMGRDPFWAAPSP